MTALQIYLFGPPQITANGSSEIHLTRGNQNLLAYLLIYRHRDLTRESLIDTFWTDAEATRARNNLNTALWRLRNSLGPQDQPSKAFILTKNSGEVSFNTRSDYWLDIEQFENHVEGLIGQPAEALTQAAAAGLEKCLALYKGDFLEGCYEDWALFERERLRLLYLKALGILMSFHQHAGAYDRAIACGQKILALDPLREEIHRAVMRLYVLCRQRPKALQQYQACCQVLSDELNILPMEETQLLYSQIALGISTVKSSAVDGSSTVAQMVAELSQAMSALEEQNRQVMAIIQRLKRFLDTHED
jgi:DNA-binding SARP family transcriptional activator